MPIVKLPNYLLEAASTDKTRQALHDAYVCPEKRAIYAVDGRILAKIPITEEGEVKELRITPQDWKMAKAIHAKEFLLDTEKATLNGHPLTDGGEFAYQFPKCEQVIPTEMPDFTVSLNPFLLIKLAKAMGLKNSDFLTLKMHESHVHNGDVILGGILASYGENTGVIMPARGGSDGLAKHLKKPERSDIPKTPPEETQKPEPEKVKVPEHSPTPPKEEKPPAPKARKTAKKATKKATTRKATPPASAPPVLSRNEEKNGIELRFNGAPDEVTRERMKANGFRFYFALEGKPWCAPYSEEAWVFAKKLAAMPERSPTETTPKPEKILPDIF